MTTARPSTAAHRPSDKAKVIAENYVKNTETYLSDGYNLNFIESKTNNTDVDEFIFTFSFNNKHAGYGSIKGKILPRVITSHRIVVGVKNGQITKAITDERWDELHNKELSVNQVKKSVSTLKYIPQQCVDTPWEAWTKEQENKARFSGLSDQDVMISYYQTVHNVLLTSVTKETATGVAACSACGCSRSYAYIVQIRGTNAGRLIRQGWKNA
jgi:hypothetical protein